MKLGSIIAAIEEFAPQGLQESWDNSGLQVGLPAGEDEVNGVLICLDVNEDIVAEAVSTGCNLIVSHHPLIFKGLKSLTGRTMPERIVAAAIRAGVAIYSAHTSLDSTRGGISYRMAQLIGARVLSVLEPTELTMERISITCPNNDADDIRLTLLDIPGVESATAWQIEDNSLHTNECDGIPSISITGTPLTRIEVIVPSIHRGRVLGRLQGSPAKLNVSVEPLANHPQGWGLGVIARFDTPCTIGELVSRLHTAFGTPAIRSNLAAANPDSPVSVITLCGGSAGEFISRAAAAGADAYICADIRYHDFADNRSGMAIFDIGHFESEKCAIDIFFTVLCEKFPNFAVRKTNLENCNPVIYL